MPRQGISDHQRKALRDWYRNQQPPPKQRDVADWFFAQFNHRISQSTVSDCLHKRYCHLDDVKPASVTTFRYRAANWPILEKILYEWQQNIELRGGYVTGELLIQKAKSIWPQIPQYQHLEAPEFSTGWLAGYKSRHKVLLHTQHGEINPTFNRCEEEMRALQTISGSYQASDIFTMDEAGLFWRSSPSRALSTQATMGLKKEKSRIALMLCTNATGTEKLPLWLLGRAKRPRSFGNLNIPALGGCWRSNQRGWCNSLTMEEWLLSFYQYISPDRYVLLLMDSSPAHTAAVRLHPPPPNVHIQFLPTSSTGHFQPLEQGITHSLKLHYRKQWLCYMIQQLDLGINPLETMNLNMAVHWILHAWHFDVTTTTIFSCFRKSNVLVQPTSQFHGEPPMDLTALFHRMQQTGHLQDAIGLAHFLQPENEDAEPMATAVELDELIAFHTGQDGGHEEFFAEDEDMTIPVPGPKEALEGLRSFILYEENNDKATVEDIRCLKRLEGSLMERLMEAQRQTMEGWIMQ